MQPQQQSLQMLRLSKTTFNKDAFTAYAATPAIITNIDFVKDILDKINVCDDCRCGCIRPTRMIIEGCS